MIKIINIIILLLFIVSWGGDTMESSMESSYVELDHIGCHSACKGRVYYKQTSFTEGLGQFSQVWTYHDPALECKDEILQDILIDNSYNHLKVYTCLIDVTKTKGAYFSKILKANILIANLELNSQHHLPIRVYNTFFWHLTSYEEIDKIYAWVEKDNDCVGYLAFFFNFRLSENTLFRNLHQDVHFPSQSMIQLEASKEDIRNKLY